MKRPFWRVPLILALTITASAQQTQPPLSLDQIQAWVELIRKNIRTESEGIDAIKSRGVDFVATNEIVATLRQSGAKQNLVDAIVRIAPKPPPPPTGSISIKCAPVECDVRINQQIIGPSQNGRLAKEGLPLGEATIEIGKEGYISQQRRVTVAREPGAELSVNLLPTEATKAANGQALLKSVLTALGVQDSTSKVTSLTGQGSVTSYVAGKSRELSFGLEARPPATLEMTVTGQQGSLVLKCEGEACQPGGNTFLSKIKLGGKKLPKDVADEVESNLREFSRYSLPSVIKALTAVGVQLSAVSSEPIGGAEMHLLANASDAAYDVNVGSDLSLVAIEYNPKSGLGGATVFYGMYADLGNGARYPKRTSVRSKDGMHGVEVRFEKLEVFKNK